MKGWCSLYILIFYEISAVLEAAKSVKKPDRFITSTTKIKKILKLEAKTAKSLFHDYVTSTKSQKDKKLDSDQFCPLVCFRHALGALKSRPNLAHILLLARFLLGSNVPKCAAHFKLIKRSMLLAWKALIKRAMIFCRKIKNLSLEPYAWLRRQTASALAWL